MQAKAAICLADGTFIIDQVHIGDPGPGEVMVQIKASGVCHTDHKMLPLPPIRIMGHEGAGVVTKVGPTVTQVREGHTVVPAAAVLKMTADIPFTSACILGCCVMTGYGSVVNVAKVEPGSSVVVIGAG